MKAHELSENVGHILSKYGNDSSDTDAQISDDLLLKLRRRIIVDAADDTLRQNALQNALEKEPKFDAVPFVRYATMEEKRKYVLNLKEELFSIQVNENDQQSVMSSIFGGIIGSKSRTKSTEYIDPESAAKLKKYKRLKKDFEREDKSKKLGEFKTKKHEEFDIRDFFKYLKIIRIELEPLLFGYRMFKCIREWRNPGLSLLVFLVLQLIAYLDYVGYLPAIVFIANGCLLVSCKQNLEYTLSKFEGALIFAGFDPESFDREKVASERYASQYKIDQNGKKNGKNKMGIMDKIKMARYKFHLVHFEMGFHQKTLADFSVILGRFRTIYKWEKLEKSQIFCLFSIFLGLALIFIPLRYVFAVSVFGLFFKHNPWRSEKEKMSKGIIDRYIESIPPSIPEIDSDRDEDDEEERESNGENESFLKRMKRKGSSGLAGRKNTSSDDTDS